MLRYFVIAAILVVAAAILMVNGIGRSRGAPKIVPGHETVSSAKGYANVGASPTDGPFVGDAVWALSALPDCLIQKSESSGSAAFARASLPAGARPVVAPATLHYGPCTIQVRADDAEVLRGADRLHIPAVARFYRLGDRLFLFHQDGSSAQLRTYAPSNF